MKSINNYVILILMKLKFSFLILLLAIVFFLISPCYARRKRVRKPRKRKAYVSRGVHAQVRFRPDKLGLLINFSHFDNLASGRYELVYETNGIPQGVGGSIILGDTSTKELLFGTCSGNVCNFHKNITNARLSIISVLKNGTTILKPYRIRF